MDNALLKRWHEIDALFDQALQRDEDERTAFLRVACGSDTELYHEVVRLLDAVTEAEDTIGDSVDVFAGSILHGIANYFDAWQDFEIGARVGPFRIEEILGKGGMGIVYLGRRVDGLYDQRVAVKIVKRGMDTDEVIERFISERQMLARLEHPAIARLIDGGVTNDSRPYLVMEYVDGEPIDTYADSRRQSIRQRLILMRAVCEPVAFAHRNLIIHRDLKPSNILVTRSGAVKLLDFGVATLLDVDDSNRTRTGLRLMTPAYASPEQTRGELITTSSDVYQLGVLLHEMLVGQRPDATAHDRGNAARAASGEIGKNPTDDAAARRGLSSAAQLSRLLRGDLGVILARALYPEPDRRYSSAQALSEDIGRYLAGLPAYSDDLGRLVRLKSATRYDRCRPPDLIGATLV